MAHGKFIKVKNICCFHFSGNQCLEEMYRLLTCWKDSGYNDMYCKHEIISFTKCVADHVCNGIQLVQFCLSTIENGL